MELRGDDLHSVSLMADSLADSLAQSRTKTAQIEDLIRGIASNVDLEAPVSHSREEDGEAELRRLKEENLQLLMDIQRQEYLSKQWNSAIAQNQRLLDTIKEWGQTHPAHLRGQYRELQTRAGIVIDELNESIAMLNAEAEESAKEVQGLVAIVQELQQLVDQDIDDGPEIENNIQDVIKRVLELQDNYIRHVTSGKAL